MEGYSVVDRAVQALDEQRQVCVDGQLMLLLCGAQSCEPDPVARADKSVSQGVGESLGTASSCFRMRYSPICSSTWGAHGARLVPIRRQAQGAYPDLRTTNPAQMAAAMTSQSDGQPRTTARCATPGPRRQRCSKKLSFMHR
jgi:hypothetical protein